jgi:hypothetical protein
MRITRDNYEVYFIDLIDGTLDASLQEEMQLFLAANPDLAEEMDGLDGFSFNAESHSGINKSDLYKTVAPGEKPVHPPVVSKHEKPIGAKPVVLPRLKAPEVVFDAKAMLYQQEAAAHWNLLPGFGARRSKHINASNLIGSKVNGMLPKLVAPTIIFEGKDALYQTAATVIPIAPKSETGARVITMRRAMYYTSAAAAIAVLLWFNMPSTSHKAGMASEWEKEVVNGVSKDPIRENSAPSKSSDMERVDDVSNDVAYQPKKNNRPSKSGTIVPNKNEAQEDQENSPKEIIELPEENYANQNPVINPIDPNENSFGGNGSGSIINTSSNNKGASNSRRYSSVLEFAENKAKETLWGSEDYPEDNFTSSLVKRQFDKTKEERDLPVDLERKEEGKRRVWRIRIGKFEYVRTR